MARRPHNMRSDRSSVNRKPRPAVRQQYNEHKITNILKSFLFWFRCRYKQLQTSPADARGRQEVRTIKEIARRHTGLTTCTMVQYGCNTPSGVTSNFAPPCKKIIRAPLPNDIGPYA